MDLGVSEAVAGQGDRVACKNSAAKAGLPFEGQQGGQTIFEGSAGINGYA